MALWKQNISGVHTTGSVHNLFDVVKSDSKLLITEQTINFISDMYIVHHRHIQR